MAQADERPGARWGRRLFGALILLLVAVSVPLLLWLIGRIPDVLGTQLGEWNFAFFFIGQLLTAAVALLLAAALALRGSRRGYSRALALSLVAVTLSVLVILTVPALVPATEDGLLHRLLVESWVVVPVAMLVGSGAFLRFSVLFPRPLTPEEIARIGKMSSDDSLGRMDRWLAGLAAWALQGGGRERIASEDGPSIRRRVRDKLTTLVPDSWLRLARTKVVVDGGRLITDPRLLWTWVGVLVAAPLLGWLASDLLQNWLGDHVVVDLLEWLLIGIVFLVVLTPVGALILGVALLRLGYALADDADRRRMRWIVESLNALVWGGLALLPFFVLGELGVESEFIDLGVSFIFGGLPLIVVSGLAFAVFYDGALEPRLVVRKSTLYGLFGFGLAFLFAITEEMVTNHMTAQLGLPDGTGTLVASGVIAVVFGVFHGRFNRKVRGWLEEDDAGGVE